jgi:hypothetical protein
LPVIDQTLEGVAAAGAENKERSAQRVAGQDLPAQGRQTIDAFAEIHRLDRHQDPHVWSDLDHRLRLQNASAKAISALASPDICTVIFARPPSHNSTVHARPAPFGQSSAGNSTNPLGAAAEPLEAERGAEDSSFRRSLLYSNPNCPATELTPCVAAKVAAALQSSSGSRLRGR